MAQNFEVTCPCCEALLVIEIPDDVLVDYEWMIETSGGALPSGEFLIPAEIVNRYGPPEIVDEEGPEQTSGSAM